MSKITYQKNLNDIYIDHYTHQSPKNTFTNVHTHNEFELLYILNGDITHVIEDRKYKLKKHDLVIIKPNNYHFIQIDSPEDYERYDILFSSNNQSISNTHLLPDNLEVLNCLDKPIITDIFKKIDFYTTIMSQDRLRDIVSLLISELIYYLSSDHSVQNFNSLKTVNPTVSKVLEEINSNLFTVNNIKQIANKLFVSESYLYRIFKQELNITPSKYITEKRLNTAKSLLEQGHSPTKIYEKCGFTDYSTFYRNYNDFFGYPPSEEKGNNFFKKIF